MGDIFDDEGVKIGENYGNTNWDYIALALFTVVTKFTFKMICDALENGL